MCFGINYYKMNVKTKVFWFKIWAEVLLVVSALGSLSLKIFTSFLDGIAWGTVLILLVVTVLYFYGKYLERQETKHYY